MATRIVFQSGSLIENLKKPKVFIPLLVLSAVAVAALFFLLVSSGSSMEENESSCLVREENNEMELVALGNELFTNRLFSTLISVDDGNVIVSPFSISNVIAMASLGSQGATLTEIRNNLQLPCNESALRLGFRSLTSSLSSSSSLVSSANALFLDEGVAANATVATKLSSSFNTSVSSLPLSSDPVTSAQTINEFVAKATRDKIKELIEASSLSEHTKMLLINAVYFKGQWKLPFNSEMTKSKAFEKSNNSMVNIDMMEQTDTFEVADFSRARVLRMHYATNDTEHQMAMYIVLPNTKEEHVLKDLVVEEQLIENLSKLKFTRRETHLVMPKFKMTQTFKMKKVLNDLGLKTMFMPGEADFKGLLNNSESNIYVDFVVHSAVLEVDEEGTEAAAATGMGLRATSFKEPIEFICNQPFIFAIRHESLDMTLFVGKFEEPQNT